MVVIPDTASYKFCSTPRFVGEIKVPSPLDKKNVRKASTRVLTGLREAE